MTDNFNRFREFMQLPEQEGGDAYYVIELVRRGKDCPDLPAANYHFKNYYIDTLAKYDKVQDEIRLLCRTLRLRAYVSVCRKSFRRVTMNTLAEMARRAALDDFKRPDKIFSSCSGEYVDKDDRHWVVDVDDCSFSSDDSDAQPRWTRVQEVINECEPEGDKIEMVLPTRTGVHLITRPFHYGDFHWKWNIELCEKNVPEIKKNHLTLLFEDL